MEGVQSPLPVFFLIALARQCVPFGPKKMMHVQNGLPRRAIAGISNAAHEGIGVDLGRGEVLSSMGHLGGVAIGDVADSGGSAHSRPYHDVKAVSIEHTVSVHGLSVQGTVGGAVPGHVDAMGLKDFSNTCPNLKHTPAGLSHRSYATFYSKIMTAQDKIRQHF
jgi:hypothetical protein